MPKQAREIPWIEERESVFYVNWYDKETKRTKRFSLRTSDPAEAQNRYVTFLAEGGPQTKPVGHSGLTIKQALDKYYFEHVRVKCADWLRQEAAISHLKAFFGDTLVAEVDARRSRVYAEAREKGVVCGTKSRKSRSAVPATIRRELNVLVAAMNHCAKWGHCKKAEVNTLDLPTVGEGADGEEVLWYTKTELNSLIYYAEGDLRDFIILAYYTGARRAAIEYLTLPQIRMGEKRIYLLPPGKKQTKKRMPIVPIFPEMEEVLKRRIGDRFEGNLFDPVRDFYRPFNRLCNTLGLDHKANPHMLRHTRATHLLQDGAPVYAVAKLLGDTIRTVERVYGHHSPDFLADVLKGGSDV